MLDVGPYQVALINTASRQIEPVAGFADAKNMNPQWAADGRAIYFLSDRGGITNVYRVTPGSGDLRQSTNVQTGISGSRRRAPRSRSRSARNASRSACTRVDSIACTPPPATRSSRACRRRNFPASPPRCCRRRRGATAASSPVSRTLCPVSRRRCLPRPNRTSPACSSMPSGSPPLASGAIASARSAAAAWPFN